MNLWEIFIELIYFSSISLSHLVIFFSYSLEQLGFGSRSGASVRSYYDIVIRCSTDLVNLLKSLFGLWVDEKRLFVQLSVYSYLNSKCLEGDASWFTLHRTYYSFLANHNSKSCEQPFAITKKDPPVSYLHLVIERSLLLVLIF